VKRLGAEDTIYVAAVLTLYADLPDTPLRPSPMDQSVARKLHQEAFPLALVESALLLATLRRLTRSSDPPPLPKVRSLAYFLPVIAELQQQPLPDAYLHYLRLKLSPVNTHSIRMRLRQTTLHGVMRAPAVVPTLRCIVSELIRSSSFGNAAI